MLSTSSTAAAAGIPSSTARATSTTHIVRRRSQRSTSAPPSTPKSSHGSVPAAVTTASAIGSRVNVNAISGSAACDTPSPSEDTVCAVHIRPNPVGGFRTSEVTWRPPSACSRGAGWNSAKTSDASGSDGSDSSRYSSARACNRAPSCANCSSVSRRCAIRTCRPSTGDASRSATAWRISTSGPPSPGSGSAIARAAIA